MAMFVLLAASMDSGSRLDPPGWIMAVIPAAERVSTESLKGKNASEAATAFWQVSPACSMAISTDLILLICPAPIPIVTPSLARTMALDLTCLQMMFANCRSSMVFLSGVVLVTVLGVMLVVMVSASWMSMAPGMWRTF